MKITVLLVAIILSSAAVAAPAPFVKNDRGVKPTIELSVRDWRTTGGVVS